MNAYENRFDFASIIKFALIALVSSLIIGLVLYNLTQFTVYQYGYNATTGLTVLAFPLGVLISVGLLSAKMENLTDSMIMGLAAGVLTAVLQSPVITLVMGRLGGGWFDTYIGNQIVLLIIFAVIGAYLGNVYLKQRI